MTKRSLSVLLVEDKASDASVYIRKLDKSAEVDVATKLVTTLSDARAALQLKSFDVVLLDLTLPDSHGIDSVDKINKTAPHTPIVVMSGWEDLQVAEKCFEAGALDFLPKNANIPTDLLVRNLLYAIKQKEINLRNQKKKSERDKVSKGKPDLSDSDELLDSLDDIELLIAKGLSYLAASSPGQFYHISQIYEEGGLHNKFSYIRSLLKIDEWVDPKTRNSSEETIEVARNSVITPGRYSQEDADAAITAAIAGLRDED